LFTLRDAADPGLWHEGLMGKWLHCKRNKKNLNTKKGPQETNKTQRRAHMIWYLFGVILVGELGPWRCPL